MSRSPDYLYGLLPAIYRMRDVERGLPLRDLLRVISEQVDVVEKDIARLYENWFIETCDDWVVPYIGDLIGHRPVEGGAAPVAGGPDGRARHRILVSRREVAGTLGFRRRKGTLALLEDFAAAVAGWPARAVEFYTLLGWTQHLDHQRPQRGRTVDLRDGDALDLVDGPFDRLAHTVEVRRIISQRTQGRSNIPSVGVFVWRRKVYSVTRAPAYCLEERAPHLFTFSALGNDTPLHARPKAETEPTHIAEEINLPTPIRRRALEERLSERPLRTRASAAYYGEGKSLSITAPDWPTKGAPQPVPRKHVVPADLSEWQYRPEPGYLAVDPVLGRIAFPSRRLPKQGVWVSFHYAFSADMGGGEYDRPLSQPEGHAFYRVSKDPRVDTFPTIGEALAQWRADQQAAAAASDDATDERLRAAVIEIDDSAVYVEPLAIALEAGESLQIRAGNRRRPIIRLLDYMTERPDAFSIAGKRAGRVVLDGLIIAGRGVQISGPDPCDKEAWAGGDLCDVRIRHCTLVPGSSLHCDCEPKRPNEPSLELLGTSARLYISYSIIGSIQVSASEVAGDPIAIEIADSIVDATSLDRVAVGAVSLPSAFARLTVLRSTVLGSVHVHAVALAENSIFASPVFVARRQLGCVRYCYVAPVSRTPRRHRCQPDLVRAAVDEQQPPVPMDERPAPKDRETARVRPVFVSTRYGTAGYCQLALVCAEEIRRGADDEAELGAFHDLFQPQRAANLRARLDEYTPADMEAGIVYAHEEFGR